MSCFKKNDLIIPGTRQDQRLSKMLHPDYVLPDERSMADLLVFISKYAELLRFYSIPPDNETDYVSNTNWKPLIQSDESFQYAGISVTKYNLPNITFYDYVKKYETESTIAKRLQAYRVWWDLCLSLYQDIDVIYTGLAVHIPLRNDIGTEIINALSQDLLIVTSSYIHSTTLLTGPLVSPFSLKVATSAADAEYKFRFAKDILAKGFADRWIYTPFAPAAETWNEYITAITGSTTIANEFFKTAELTDFDRVDYSTIQLKQIFKRAFEAFVRIVQKATSYLEQSINNNSSHYAHHGLLLAFLRLFKLLQNNLNEFTAKHLDYFYQQVLTIRPAPASPDSAHVVLEPAKNTVLHLIKKDTVFNGGKDATGKLLLYKNSAETTISQAKVAQLKSLFLKPLASDATKVQKVYATDVANSEDGKGKPFAAENSSWKAFGDIKLNGTQETNVAQLGFYIASPALHLTDGTRTITFTFTTDLTGYSKAQSWDATKINSLFSIFFSTEKGWQELLNGITGTISAGTPNFFSKTFAIQLTLNLQFPPVLGFDAKVCDGNLNTVFPAVKFVLKQQTADAYQQVRNIKITAINITTVSDGMTNLSLNNDGIPLNPPNPVQPFGPLPKLGATFYIGHKELEHKEITSFQVNLNWQELPALPAHYEYKSKIATTPFYETKKYVNIASKSDFKASVNFIRDKAWLAVKADSSFFNDEVTTDAANATLLFNSITTIKKSQIRPETYTNEPVAFKTDTQNGFLGFSLKAPIESFGHNVWPAVFAGQTISIASAPPANPNEYLPKPPYTPMLQTVSLKYTAKDSIDFTNKNNGQYFHLLPFGMKELTSNIELVSNFKFQEKLTNLPIQDEDLESGLLIGISDADTLQNITLFIQLDEGTEDIRVNPPIIQWNYLSTAGWRHLDKALLADSTLNLIKSGLVSFQVPLDIATTVTELPNGYSWISAAIKENSDALPKVLGVFTNGLKVTFEDHQNDPAHLATALPAGSIAKLLEPDAAVKKVLQPYPSFDGKVKEEGGLFYNRVSERLRHKQRAITIWDYERLVLKEFPEVFMVKCLNHTGYEKNCSLPNEKGTYTESLPGHVLLIPLPYANRIATGNKLQPMFSTSKLATVKNFIHGLDNAGSCNPYQKSLHCQLAELKVESPVYEPITITCKVQVKPCLDQLFYKAQLVTDLDEFLSPWLKGDPGALKFGGELHASMVVYFIEQLFYIDYLEELTIKHYDENGVHKNPTDTTRAVATTARSILTSRGDHEILP